jgi:hypothetical protein
MFLIAISASVLVGSFVIGSQLVQPSMAQETGQLGEQVKEKNRWSSTTTHGR